MLAEMPAPLFNEWTAYEMVEPDPLPRIEVMLAQLLTLYANVHRDIKKRRAPYQVQDFILDKFGHQRVKPQTPQQTYGLVKAWAVMSGAKIM